MNGDDGGLYTVSFQLPKSYHRAFDRLVEAEIAITGLCMDAIAAKAAELDAWHGGFAEGNEVRVTLHGAYCGMWGTVKGYWQHWIEVMLYDRRLVMFAPKELEPREED